MIRHDIGAVIAAWRWANHLGVRKVAKSIGISPATLSRVENEGAMDGKTMWKIMHWLFASEEADNGS